MKKSLVFVLLFALLLSSCQTPDSSSQDISQASEIVSSTDEVSEQSTVTSSVQDISAVSDIPTESGDVSTVPIPEDEPFVQLTALTEDEISALNLPEGYLSAEYKDGFFTKELIAVSFIEGGTKGSEYMHLVVSRDGGETWEEQIINEDYYYQSFITFSSEKNGCVVLQGENWLGGQGLCFIYVTHDGGKNWQEVTSTNTVSTWGISDALFISRNIGFVCHIGCADLDPVFCRTIDGGMTWEKVVLDTEKLKNGKASYGHIKTAAFKDGVIEFTVEFCNNNAKKESERIYYTKYVSTDMGESFERAE